MGRLFIFPWKMAGASGAALSEALNVRRVYPDRNYKPRDGDVIVNWGNSTYPDWWPIYNSRSGTTIINDFPAVNAATNKITALKIMRDAGVRVPDFTTDPDEALKMLEDGPLVGRRIIKGHGAMGIEIIPEPEYFLDVPLYTKYIKKKDEYRVHIFNGEVLDVTQKKLRHGLNGAVDYKVRNHAGGWVYARTNIDPPQDVIVQSIAAVSALGLNFGAVDVGWNAHYQQAHVYEVNTAPGLVGTTLYKYSRKIASMYPRYTTLNMEDPHDGDAVIDDMPMEYDEDTPAKKNMSTLNSILQKDKLVPLAAHDEVENIEPPAWIVEHINIAD